MVLAVRAVSRWHFPTLRRCRSQHCDTHRQSVDLLLSEEKGKAQCEQFLWGENLLACWVSLEIQVFFL